ncbi:hypothetical protein AAAC51_26145 [Priestia megaterium]
MARSRTFITAHTTNQGQGESASGQRIGYDMDDSKLGDRLSMMIQLCLQPK